MTRRLTGLMSNPESLEPLHRQVFDQVVDRIRSGTFPVGFRLPPTRTLAREAGMHRNTVVRAYGDLEAAGFVISHVGRGTFVAETRVGPVSRPPSEVPPARRDVVRLERLEPADELVPVELLRRCVDHVLRTRGAAALVHAPVAGLARLRGLIADDLARQGVPAAAEDVIVTNGRRHALHLVARAIVRSGGPFAVDALTFADAPGTLESAGATLVAVPSDGEGTDVRALGRLARPPRGYYAMPHAHDPTGVTMPLSRRVALVGWARESGAVIVEDDYACGLGTGADAAPPPLRSLDGGVVYIGTLGAEVEAALHLGFVVCPRALRPALVALTEAEGAPAPALLQHALAEFMERGYLRAHARRAAETYAARGEALESALRSYAPRLAERLVRSALHVWLALPDGHDPSAVAEQASAHGVAVAPSTRQRVGRGGRGGLRLALGAEPPERLREGARRLASASRGAFA